MDIKHHDDDDDGIGNDLKVVRGNPIKKVVMREGMIKRRRRNMLGIMKRGKV